MSNVKNVSGTAFVIAAFREEENEAHNPLYTDKVVKLFLNDDIKETAKSIAQNFPAAKEMIKLRTKYFDDVLSQQIHLGYQQVVILGSGLDTRPVRQNAQDVTYFEIDDGATLGLKEDSLNKNNILANVHYVPGDYVKEGVVSLLKQNQFNFELPTYLLWEGNTTLIRKEDVISVLNQIRNNFDDFRLSFDYMSDKVILRTTGYDDINDYIDRYEKLYTPWITGFESIEPLAQDLGLNVLENLSMTELFNKYRPNHPLESNLFSFYFVCTLERFKFSSI
jgi:methyltransferase (TIGR00027 family)